MVSKLWFIDSSELFVPFQVVVRSKLFSKEYQAVFHIYLFSCVNTCTCWCKKTDSKITGALPGSKAIALNHTSSDHILKHNSHMKISCILILILYYCIIIWLNYHLLSEEKKLRFGSKTSMFVFPLIHWWLLNLLLMFQPFSHTFNRWSMPEKSLDN